MLKGNKPDYHEAMPPGDARVMYEAMVARLRELHGADKVSEGEFGAMMSVDIVNDGPVTITLDKEIDANEGKKGKK